MIGTDATQAQHIEKVVGERGYARKVGDNRLTPTELGEALVLAYDRMGVADMWLPTKRAKMEADVDAVAHNRMDPHAGLRSHLQTMLEAYDRIAAEENTLTNTVDSYMLGGGGGERRRGGAPQPPHLRAAAIILQERCSSPSRCPHALAPRKACSAGRPGDDRTAARWCG